MFFGPEIVVSRVVPSAGKIGEVVLAAHTSDQLAGLLPLSVDTTNQDHLYADKWEALQSSDPDLYTARYLNDLHSINWGVFAQEQFAGVARLTKMPYRLNKQRVSYGIALGHQYRGKGIGGLVTAGVVRAAFTPGLLSRTNADFSKQVDFVLTSIHNNNEASQAMCRGAGFTRWSEMDDGEFGGYYLPRGKVVSNPDIIVALPNIGRNKKVGPFGFLLEKGPT